MKQTHFFSVLRVSLVLSKLKKHRDVSVKVFYSDFDVKLKNRLDVRYKKAFVEYSEYYKSLEEAFDKTLSIDLALNHPTGSLIRKKRTAFLKARSKLYDLWEELPKMGIKDYRYFDWTEYQKFETLRSILDSFEDDLKKKWSERLQWFNKVSKEDRKVIKKRINKSRQDDFKALKSQQNPQNRIQNRIELREYNKCLKNKLKQDWQKEDKYVNACLSAWKIPQEPKPVPHILLEARNQEEVIIPVPEPEKKKNQGDFYFYKRYLLHTTWLKFAEWLQVLLKMSQKSIKSIELSTKIWKLNQTFEKDLKKELELGETLIQAYDTKEEFKNTLFQASNQYSQFQIFFEKVCKFEKLDCFLENELDSIEILKNFQEDFLFKQKSLEKGFYSKLDIEYALEAKKEEEIEFFFQEYFLKHQQIRFNIEFLLEEVEKIIYISEKSLDLDDNK